MKKNLIILILFILTLPYVSFSQDDSKENQGILVRNKRHTGQPLANLIRGPYLQVATSNSITIRWRTDTWARSRVRFGTSPDNLNLTADDSALVLEHEVKLTDLLPRTKYYYSIGGIKDTLQIGPDNYFVTLPVSRKKGLYRIGAFGDVGNNSRRQRNVRDAVISYLGDNYMDAWLLLGDNAYKDGEDSQYQENFFNVYKDDLLRKYPLYTVPGNHDYHDVEYSTLEAQKSHEVAYYKNFSMPTNGEAGGVPSQTQSYFSHDLGNIHFLSLDSYGMEEGTSQLYDTLSRQVEWLKKDLEANRNKDWIIAYWHHPPYTMGSHNSDTEEQLVKIRENFIQILERYGVDLVLGGHSHLYERSKLIKGHYGPNESFNPSVHTVSSSTGFYDNSKNSCPYIKSSENQSGTVYVVAGSAGQLEDRVQSSYPHNAMVYSNSKVSGAVMLEVEDNRLDLKWITEDGQILDKFTMMKNLNKKSVIRIKKGEKATLKASFIGNYNWKHSKELSRAVEVSPSSGKTTYTVSDDCSCIKEEFEVIVIP